MFRLTLIASLVMGIFSVAALAAEGVETKQKSEQVKEQGAAKPQVRQREQVQQQVYGSQLMTRQERLEYHKKMRGLKTDAEREQFRNEHHQKMQERAKAKGVTLPDEPPVPGGRMGPGGGIGPGGGMGPGGGGR